MKVRKICALRNTFRQYSYLEQHIFFLHDHLCLSLFCAQISFSILKLFWSHLRKSLDGGDRQKALAIRTVASIIRHWIYKRNMTTLKNFSRGRIGFVEEFLVKIIIYKKTHFNIKDVYCSRFIF